MRGVGKKPTPNESVLSRLNCRFVFLLYILLLIQWHLTPTHTLSLFIYSASKLWWDFGLEFGSCNDLNTLIFHLEMYFFFCRRWRRLSLSKSVWNSSRIPCLNRAPCIAKLRMKVFYPWYIGNHTRDCSCMRFYRWKYYVMVWNEVKTVNTRSINYYIISRLRTPQCMILRC